MISGTLEKRRSYPSKLIENKVTFCANDSELSVYDTFQQAERVKLKSDQLLFCGMVTGKKVMHVDHDNYHHAFLPHESFILVPNQEVEIDFPVAEIESPTTCLAIEISKEKISSVCKQLNIDSALPHELGEWQYAEHLVHTHHNASTQQLLNRIVDIFCENHCDRSYLIDLAVNELTARLLRHQTRDLMLAFCHSEPDHNGLNQAISYIVNHLDEALDVDVLCKIACMSRTKFYNDFKQVLACTPSAFQIQMRIKRAAKLIASGKQITHTAFALGFHNSSHFSRCFKSELGMSPRDYRDRKRHN